MIIFARRATALVLALLAAVWTCNAVPADAVVHALVQGAGATSAANGVNQWAADLHAQGIQLIYTALGSQQGRRDFANRTVDYAVSDTAFQGVDPVTGISDTSNGRAFTYVPLISYGVAFPYHIESGGISQRNVRLSGPTLARIFSHQIINWSDPRVTADNNGRQLPDLAITTVVHSEASGTSHELTDYFSSQNPSIWTRGVSEYFPRIAGDSAASSSDAVMNLISSSSGNGSIGFDEYAYAVGRNYPVIKVLNSGGYYTLPSADNVAIALTAARTYSDPRQPTYGQADLSGVYSNIDPRTYPLSGYIYGILPTAPDDPTMTTAKRQTLADVFFYGACQGQGELGAIGYGLLPENLVQSTLNGIQLLQNADPNVDLSTDTLSQCNSATFSASSPNNLQLQRTAPQPSACDQQGSGPCQNSGISPPSPAGSCDPTLSPCSNASIVATVPVGALVLSTPYTPSNPINLGTLSLSTDATLLQATAPLSNIVVSDTRSGDLPYTVSAQATNLTDGAQHPNSAINAENLGLTEVTFAASPGFTGSVTITQNVAATGVPPGDPGTAGLGGTEHTIATADHGAGSITLQGLISVNAPSSTEAGLFTGTITFTVG